MVIKRDIIKLGHLNARSLFTGFNEFSNLVHHNMFDIFGVSETWLSTSVESRVVEIPDYHILRNDRSGREGGIAVYVKNYINCSLVPSKFQSSQDLENLWIEIKLRNYSLVVGILYRPPASDLHRCIERLDGTLATLIPIYSNIVVLGDVNVNLFNVDVLMHTVSLKLSMNPLG